ncbi:MAG: hypothetical protein HYU34_03165 [Candidatus Omnitrophica bacterium]|nr:hypothetical protein [Candidatus Omnitrophota bacterium]
MTPKLKLIYSLMFVTGIALIYVSRGSFSRNSLLSGFGIAATLTASYLWIRLDWWRSIQTIKELSDSNKSIARDLISKKADSRVALALLILVALAQALLEEYRLALGMLLVLIPIGNYIARSIERCLWQADGFKEG